MKNVQEMDQISMQAIEGDNAFVDFCNDVYFLLQNRSILEKGQLIASRHATLVNLLNKFFGK